MLGACKLNVNVGHTLSDSLSRRGGLLNKAVYHYIILARSIHYAHGTVARDKISPSALHGERANSLARAFRHLEVVHFEPAAAVGAACARKRRRGDLGDRRDRGGSRRQLLRLGRRRGVADDEASPVLRPTRIAGRALPRAGHQRLIMARPLPRHDARHHAMPGCGRGAHFVGRRRVTPDRGEPLVDQSGERRRLPWDPPRQRKCKRGVVGMYSPR